MVGAAGGAAAWISWSHPSPGTVRVAFGGDLDLASLRRLEDEISALLTSTADRVELDVSAVTFLDSSAIALLVRIANHFGTASLVGASGIVRRTIDALGLGEHLGLAAPPNEPAP